MERASGPLWDRVRGVLLDWFPSGGRSFPWRKNANAYAILVAEILLKKTDAAAVAAFLPTFLRAYPAPEDLAKASLENLEGVLRPLGLSRQRANQLKALGLALVESYGGQVPSSKEALLALPGVGEYTAAAVLCFAWGDPEALVDTNVARVVVRLSGITPSRYEPRRSPEVWEAARALAAGAGPRAKEANWAILDLGATICRATRPRCTDCPLAAHCAWHRTHPIPDSS